MNLYDLGNKPKGYKYTDEEFDFILENSHIKDVICKYFIWKQKRHNGLYIGFAFDHVPRQPRKSAMCNSINVIAKRKPCKLEINEMVYNYGCSNRKYHHWDYDFIERLIDEDLKYNITTPVEFISHCKNLGYTNPNYFEGKQLKLI